MIRAGLQSVCVLVCVLITRALPAQAPPEVRGEAAATNSSSDPKAIRAARAHYQRALEFAKTNDWQAALRELEASLALHPTRVALLNAGICLSRLGRALEAMEVFEDLRARHWAALTVEDRETAEDEMRALASRLAELEIVSNVDGALVALDGRVLGSTPVSRSWIAPGEHVLTASKAGSVPFEQRLRASAGRILQVQIVLEPAVPAANAVEPVRPRAVVPAARAGGSRRAARRFFLEAAAGPFVAGTLGGSECRSACSTAFPLGAFAGARFGASLAGPFALETAVGYVHLARTLDRSMTLASEWRDYPLSTRDLRDETRVSGVIVGLGASYSLLRRTPLVARVSAGFLGATARMSLVGTIRGELPQSSSRMEEVARYEGTLRLREHDQFLLVPFLSPEVRFGYRLSERLVVDLGFAVWVLFAPARPRTGGNWGTSTRRRLSLPDAAGLGGEGRVVAGIATLPRENALGTGALGLPSIGARWSF